MYEFTLDLECAGHPVGNLDIGVDATLVGDAYDLNRVYLFIGIAKLNVRHRYEQDGDYRTHFGSGSQQVWREVPSDDPFYPAIMEELDRKSNDLIAHLMKEVA